MSASATRWLGPTNNSKCPSTKIVDTSRLLVPQKFVLYYYLDPLGNQNLGLKDTGIHEYSNSRAVETQDTGSTLRTPKVTSRAKG